MSIKTVQAIVNGQTVTLALSDSGKYEGTLTAPASSSFNETGGYYPVTIKATDDAGNIATVDDTHETLGQSLRLVVKEKVAPVITITAPTDDAVLINNKPAITWTVTDDDSGVDADTIKLQIDDGAAITSGITKTPTSNGYNCSYTPESALDDGSHTIKFDASDNDGNAAAQKAVTFKIDTVPPTLSISSPAENLVTNQESCTVSGTTNDTTSSPCTVTVKLNNGAAESVEVQENGSFSKVLTLSEGENTITVVSTDSAGKSTTVTRTVTLNTHAPTISNISIVPNPVDCGNTYVISVTVTEG